MGGISEKRLVARLRAGDKEAFREAYQHYKRDVLALGATMLGDRDGAWDLLRDVFVSLARNAPGLAPRSNLRGYLLTAATNRARDYLAKRRSRKAVRDGIAGAASPASPDSQTLAAAREAGDDLRSALFSLPEEQRRVVALHIYGEMTFAEIAQRCSISENTAQSRYRYALDKLRRRFVKEAEDGRA